MSPFGRTEWDPIRLGPAFQAGMSRFWHIPECQHRRGPADQIQGPVPARGGCVGEYAPLDRPRERSSMRRRRQRAKAPRARMKSHDAKINGAADRRPITRP